MTLIQNVQVHKKTVVGYRTRNIYLYICQESTLLFWPVEIKMICIGTKNVLRLSVQFYTTKIL